MNVYTNRRHFTASDASLFEMAVRSAHIVLVTDPTKGHWHAIGRHGRALGTELPPSDWIQCPVLDISTIDTKHDELVAKIIADCTSPMVGVTDITGLIAGLTGLGAGIVTIHPNGTTRTDYKPQQNQAPYMPEDSYVPGAPESMDGIQ